MRKKTKILAFICFVFFLALLLFLLLSKNERRGLKTAYACLIKPERSNYSSSEGESLRVKLKIKNTGRVSWSSRGKNPVLLSYHILSEEKKMLKFENRRYTLAKKVRAGEETEVSVSIKSPLEEGKYFIEFDLVREGISWFKDYGSKTATAFLEVKKSLFLEDLPLLSIKEVKQTNFQSTRNEFNRIKKLIRLTLFKNEISFEGKTGNVFGFKGGEDYPQVWLRDSNTIIPVSRYFYDIRFLSTWLEEHLAHQKEDGSLEDWIDGEGNSEKNTTETDQETSAVQAAYQIFELAGREWLVKKIRGIEVVERLEKALLFVLHSRYDKDYGLITGAHTADWGDIDFMRKDEQALDVNESTHWTADIYDQSMFYKACIDLSELFESLDKENKAIFWRQWANSIKINTNKWLWMEEKGYYRIHLHLDRLVHDFDEDDIFATGGNTQAVLSGIADKEKVRRIIETALKRQKEYGLSTLSGTLLPPYPAGFFKHPLMDAPFEYQNGAQWDWFGGRLVLAMFENGFSQVAREKLLEIATKNLNNRGFFEWDNREGVGWGSDFYCGSAASIGRALFEGYFGIKIGRKNMSLEPKLGKDSGKIAVLIPANNLFFAYEYEFEQEAKKLTMKFNSNHEKRGKIKILNPWPDLFKNENDLKINLLLKLNGKRIDFTSETLNRDLFITLDTDFIEKTLELEIY